MDCCKHKHTPLKVNFGTDPKVKLGSDPNVKIANLDDDVMCKAKHKALHTKTTAKTAKDVLNNLSGDANTRNLGDVARKMIGK